MATAWIPVGVTTPRCTEVVRISCRAKKSRRETFAALVEFWIWVSQESADGFLAEYTLESLPNVIDDTNIAFWEAVSAEGWILVRDDGLLIPDNKDHQYIAKGSRARLLKGSRQDRWKAGRNDTVETVEEALAETREETVLETNFVEKASLETSPSARPTETVTETDKWSEDRNGTAGGSSPAGERSDLERIQEEELGHAATLAAALFKRSGYSGKDGGLLWQLAVLVKRGAVVESWVHSACEGSRLNATRNQIGFVRITLTETAQKHGRDLPAMLRQARLPKGCHKGPPKVVANAVVADLVNALSRKDSP